MTTKKQRRDFEEWARRATRGQADSAVFMSLWSDKIATDPRSEPAVLLQLGFALVLDKPIVIVAPHGARIPDNVRRVARSIKYFNPAEPESIQHATHAALTEAGLLPPM